MFPGRQISDEQQSMDEDMQGNLREAVTSQTEKHRSSLKSSNGLDDRKKRRRWEQQKIKWINLTIKLQKSTIHLMCHVHVRLKLRRHVHVLSHLILTELNGCKNRYPKVPKLLTKTNEINKHVLLIHPQYSSALSVERLQSFVPIYCRHLST